jgi:hypothetical protein
MTNIIVAYDQERAIGRENGLLWGRDEMSGDMKLFCKLTNGTIIIMGRNTLNLIGVEIARTIEDINTFFSLLPSSEWNKSDRVHFDADHNIIYDYDFVTYDRK